jgi:hypothetical protein
MAFKLTNPPFPLQNEEIRSKSRQAAEKKLDDKLRTEGHTSGINDPRAPKYKLTQDTKTGEYIYRTK